MKDRKYDAAAIWLIVTLFFGCAGGSHIIPQLVELHALSKFNQTAQGEIIETYPKMHSTCKYRFSVGNNAYDQTGRSCGNTVIGEKILVYYSPTNPDRSVNNNPQSLFVNDLISFLFALIIFPLAAAFAAYKRKR